MNVRAKLSLWALTMAAFGACAAHTFSSSGDEPASPNRSSTAGILVKTLGSGERVTLSTAESSEWRSEAKLPDGGIRMGGEFVTQTFTLSLSKPGSASTRVPIKLWSRTYVPSPRSVLPVLPFRVLDVSVGKSSARVLYARSDVEVDLLSRGEDGKWHLAATKKLYEESPARHAVSGALLPHDRVKLRTAHGDVEVWEYGTRSPRRTSVKKADR